MPRIIDCDSLGGWYTLRGASRLLKIKPDTLLKRVHTRGVPTLRLGTVLWFD